MKFSQERDKIDAAELCARVFQLGKLITNKTK